LRKAAERTVNGLWEAIGRIIDTYTPEESRNYFADRKICCDLIG
jgi:hypothetical protein